MLHIITASAHALKKRIDSGGGILQNIAWNILALKVGLYMHCFKCAGLNLRGDVNLHIKALAAHLVCRIGLPVKIKQMASTLIVTTLSRIFKT